MGIESGFIGKIGRDAYGRFFQGGYERRRADFIDRRRTGFGLCHDDDHSRLENGLLVHSWVQRLLCAPRSSLPKCSKGMIYCISKGIWYKTLR